VVQWKRLKLAVGDHVPAQVLESADRPVASVTSVITRQGVRGVQVDPTVAGYRMEQPDTSTDMPTTQERATIESILTLVCVTYIHIYNLLKNTIRT